MVIPHQRIIISSNESQIKKCMNDCLFADQLPEIGIRYWVQCEDFRCLAVINKDGQWKSFSNGRELPDVIKFFPR
jgi:hypothetical protein